MNKSWPVLLFYIGSSVLGVGTALMLTLHFVRPSLAQETPTAAPATSSAPAEATPANSDLNKAEVANTQGVPAPIQDPNLLGADTDENYNYDPIGKRDPFEPYTNVGPIAKTAAPSVEGGDPLLKYDVDEYTVTGIIWGTVNPRAYIKDPESRFHTVYKGQKIGNAQGVIVGIREGSLIVQEVQVENGNPVQVVRKMLINNRSKDKKE